MLMNMEKNQSIQKLKHLVYTKPESWHKKQLSNIKNYQDFVIIAMNVFL